MRSRNITKIACCLSFLMGCAFSIAARQVTTPASDTIKIYSKNNNGKISLGKSKKGAIVRIELDGPLGGNGYVWTNNTPSSPVITVVTTQFANIDPEMMGSKGKTIFLFSVTGKSGTVKMKFDMQRPWDKENKSIESFTQTLKYCKLKS